MGCRSSRLLGFVLFLSLSILSSRSVKAQSDSETCLEDAKTEIITQNDSYPCSEDCEAEAVKHMAERVCRLIRVLKRNLEAGETRLKDEKDRSKPLSYRAKSSANLRRRLKNMEFLKTDEVTDKLVERVRSDKPNDTITVSFLTDLYFGVVQDAVMEADAHVQKERNRLSLLASEVAATKDTLSLLKKMHGGLKKFEKELRKDQWRANATELAEFFASDDFKQRVTTLSNNVERLQEELAEPAQPPGQTPRQ